MDLGAQLNAEEEHFVQQHLAALQAQWDALLAHHGNLSTSLTSTMDQVGKFIFFVIFKIFKFILK
jgi:hypothetical protein